MALPRRQTFGPLGILWRSFIIRKCSPLTLETKDLKFLKLPIVSPWLTQPICILGKAHQSVYTPKWFRGNIRDTASPLLACSLLFPFSHSCLAKLFSQNQRFSKPVCLRTAMTFQGIVWKSWVPLMFICLYLLRKFCVICVPIRSSWGFPGGSVVKNLPASAGDTRDAGLTPGLGKSPGGGHGSPLQYSCLDNPKDRGAWWATVHRVPQS